MMRVNMDYTPPTSALQELLEHDWPLGTLNALWALDFWQTRRNPYFLDYAVTECVAAHVDIGPLLQAEMVKAATLRWQGKARGTRAAVQRELVTFEQLTHVAMLIYAGNSRQVALNQVVNALGLSRDKTASRFETLYKYYTKRVVKTGLEANLHQWIYDADCAADQSR